MEGDEHVVGLDRGAYEETGEWYDGQAQSSCQICVSECLYRLSVLLFEKKSFIPLLTFE